MSKRLTVSELFGPTIQGEGMLIGEPTYFIRLAGCDSRCRWCDSMHAVDTSHRAEWFHKTAEEIRTWLAERAPTGTCVTLSGGNPALQDCGELISLLREAGYRVSMETQGTVAREWFHLLNYLTISPKPPSSGNPVSSEQVLLCLEAYGRARTASTCLKIVVEGSADLLYARDMQEAFPELDLYLQPCNRSVGGQAEAEVLLEAQRVLTRAVLDLRMTRVRILPQLHVLMYGNLKGI